MLRHSVERSVLAPMDYNGIHCYCTIWAGYLLDRTVAMDAVVVHGCKDGSLHRMAQHGFSIPSDSTGLKPLNSMELKQVATNDELKPNLQNDSPQKTIKPIRKKKDKIVAKKTIQPVTVNPQDADDFIKQLRQLASNLKNPEKNTEQYE